MKAHDWVENPAVYYQDPEVSESARKFQSATCSGCGRRIRLWEGKTLEESSRLQKAYVLPDCSEEQIRRVHDA